MKEHIIRAILYQDMSVKWKDAELNGDVNVHLNVHQKTRQFVEAELGDFLLSDGEAILASFEKTIDGEIYHENPAKMERINDETNAFRLQIPTLVHNTPGEWGVQFFVVTDYDPITGNYTNSYPFDKAKFSEHSSIIDDGLTVPTGENLSVLYTEAKQCAETAKTEALSAKEHLNELKERLRELYEKMGNTRVLSIDYDHEDENGAYVYKITFEDETYFYFSSPKGEPGTGFSISKTYTSIAEMDAGYETDNVPLYGFVLIETGNVEDEDNAKLFVKGETAYEYLTDLSSSQGIKGEKGDTGYVKIVRLI